MNHPVELSVTAVIDDKDVDQVKFTVILADGKAGKDCDSFVIERALLKFAATHIPGWVEYLRNTGMKTL